MVSGTIRSLHMGKYRSCYFCAIPNFAGPRRGRRAQTVRDKYQHRSSVSLFSFGRVHIARPLGLAANRRPGLPNTGRRGPGRAWSRRGGRTGTPQPGHPGRPRRRRPGRLHRPLRQVQHPPDEGAPRRQGHPRANMTRRADSRAPAQPAPFVFEGVRPTTQPEFCPLPDSNATLQPPEVPKDSSRACNAAELPEARACLN